jgi:adenosylcobinamide kinase/adenosylcobinamide-phosphate guanylyltransferase
LITGPVRSGKSTRAVRVARDLGCPVTHVLTARLDPNDAEMAGRVARHRVERGSEAAIELWQPGAPELPHIIAGAPASTTLLIDSLGTWIAGQLFDLETLVEHDAAHALATLETLAEPLLTTVAAARGNVVLVAEEAGWGLVPMTAQGRVFRDHLGRLTRRLGQVAERVELVVAGYAIDVRRCGVAVT